jgi:large subunit ribosomal protein L21
MASVLRTLPALRCIRIGSLAGPPINHLSKAVFRQFSTENASVAVHSSEQLVKRSVKYTKPRDTTPLKEANSLFATIHLFNRKFLVTEGDTILIPVRVRDVEVGDVLNFDQVSTIGSRDYTLTGSPRIDRDVFSIKGVVVEKTRVRREVTEKTKRRRRHVRHVVIKNPLTVIRISELKVNSQY